MVKVLYFRKICVGWRLGSKEARLERGEGIEVIVICWEGGSWWTRDIYEVEFLGFGGLGRRGV